MHPNQRLAAFAAADLYVVITEAFCAGRHAHEILVQTLMAGVRLVQLREKEAPREEIIQLGRAVLEVTRRYVALLIVNDHPSVAKEIGADGVHVGREDPPVAETRAMVGPDVIIGASCYGDVERAVAAEQAGADYVAFGTPFPSPTKTKRTDISLSIFQEAKRRVHVPVFAIGGITIQNAQQVIDAGADGVAIVSGVFGAPDVEAAARALAQLF